MTLSRVVGEDAGPAGEDFWKKDMMSRCVADAVARPAGLAAGLAGVRAVLGCALSPAMMMRAHGLDESVC